jgi:hypothetical protein
MTDAELEEFLRARLASPQDHMTAAHIIGDLVKLAPLFADAETLPGAKATLERWQAEGGELRKGIATAWLARARGALEAGAEKAGELGAKAGAAIEPHSPAGRDMRDYAGGLKGRPTTSAGKKMEADAADYGRRTADAASRLRAALRPHEEAQHQADLHAGRTGRSHATDVRQGRAARADDEWVNAGARHSRQRSIAAHQDAYARMGRTAAKFGFKAGLAVAGAGTAAGAAAGAHAMLSDAQRKERVSAAKARWSHQESMNKAAARDDLAKLNLVSAARNVVRGARLGMKAYRAVDTLKAAASGVGSASDIARATRPMDRRAFIQGAATSALKSAAKSSSLAKHPIARVAIKASEAMS